MFKKLLELFEKEMAYKKALKEAEYREKLKTIPLEAKINNEKRLQKLKNISSSSKIEQKMHSKTKYDSSKPFDVLNSEF